MPNATQSTQPLAANDALRTLNARLDAQRAELATCTTVAMRRCVEQACEDTRRQMRDLLGAA